MMKTKMVGVLSARGRTTVHDLETERGIGIEVAGTTETEREVAETVRRIEIKKKGTVKREKGAKTRIVTVKCVTMKKIGRETDHVEAEVDQRDVGVRKEKRVRK